MAALEEELGAVLDAGPEHRKVRPATMHLEGTTLAAVLLGSLLSGFTSGFAGFGTALVASGLWFHALPAPMVPPLIVLSSVVAQAIGLVTVRRAFDFRRAAPFLVGGAFGVPVGVAALAAAAPQHLRAAMGVFLVSYAFYQFWRHKPRSIGAWGGRWADGGIGFAGGILGGFAGLSGPLPLIWLQLRGGTPDEQRATYQPFNFVVLGLATLGMTVGGQMTRAVLEVGLVSLPVTILGAWAGARAYIGVSPVTFQRVVLALLLASGGLLLAQTILG
ncbi:MAG: sulfite exporter TauE/SafE family protein [Hyphomicrobiaceae bacterium]